MFAVGGLDFGRCILPWWIRSGSAPSVCAASTEQTDRTKLKDFECRFDVDAIVVESRTRCERTTG